jgi:hypothetical protein
VAFHQPGLSDCQIPLLAILGHQHVARAPHPNGHWLLHVEEERRAGSVSPVFVSFLLWRI